MENFRVFECKYLSATNHKPTRMKITDTRFCKSVIISRRDRDQFIDDAIDVLAAMGIELMGKALNEKNGISYLFTDNFNTQLSIATLN